MVERSIIILYRTAQCAFTAALVVGAWLIHPVLGIIAGWLGLFSASALLGL